MNYTEYIESNPEIMLGKPVVNGTRISVSMVLRKLSEGATIQELIAAYPNLTETSIKAVLAYASNAIANSMENFTYDFMDDRNQPSEQEARESFD